MLSSPTKNITATSRIGSKALDQEISAGPSSGLNERIGEDFCTAAQSSSVRRTLATHASLNDNALDARKARICTGVVAAEIPGAVATLRRSQRGRRLRSGA